MKYFLVENYYCVPSGFVIINRFDTLEAAKSHANEEHVLSRGLPPIVWEEGFYDGKQLSNHFGKETNSWRYEIHRLWEELEGGN